MWCCWIFHGLSAAMRFRLSGGGFGGAGRYLFGWDQPGIEDGQVGWHDGEEEEEEADDLRDAEGVVGVEYEGQDDEAGNGRADDDACYGLRPWFVTVGKHLDHLFAITDNEVLQAPLWLDAAAGSTCYQYGSVGRSKAVVYIYYGNVG
jgi:hypothetical protein